MFELKDCALKENIINYFHFLSIENKESGRRQMGYQSSGCAHFEEVNYLFFEFFRRYKRTCYYKAFYLVNLLSSFQLCFIEVFGMAFCLSESV